MIEGLKTETQQIFKAIQGVMTDLEAVGKDRSNEQQRWKFRGIDDVYNALHPCMAKHGVFTASELLDVKREEHATKSGGVMTYTTMMIRYRFYAGDGSFVETSVFGEGSDTGDKSASKAMSIAHKYALLQIFAIPTEDLEDPDRTAHEKASKKEKPHAPTPRPSSSPVAPVGAPKVKPKIDTKSDPNVSGPRTSPASEAPGKVGSAHRAHIVSLCGQATGWTEQDVADFLRLEFGKKAVTQLTLPEYSALVLAMKNETHVTSPAPEPGSFDDGDHRL